MKRHTLPTFRALALSLALIAPVGAGTPLSVYIDGTLVGTLDLLEYDIASGRVDVFTNELVFGCQQDRVFRDRFEDQ